MNPRYPFAAVYYDKGQTAYVLNKLNETRTRPTRVITSFGPLYGVKIGTELALDHDQDSSWLGDYEVVGIHHFESGETAGNVIDFKLRHSVVK